MQSQVARLRERLSEVHDLRSTAAVLDWDQATHMPPGGAEARGRQIATLQRLAHERFTDDEVARLLEALEPWAREQAASNVDAALVRVAKRDWLRASKIPASFTGRLADHLSRTYNVWTKARPANDFAAVAALLETTLDLSREMAGYLGKGEHIADPLLDGNDLGMTVASARALFDALRAELVPLVRAIASRPQVDDSCLRGHFPEAAQLAFGERVIRAIGYDFARGRQDKTHHPFMTRFAHGDVRITTRVREDDLGDGLFSTIHEAGHALYEQGTDASLDGTLLGEGTSAGVHESQSRLWENLVGRSRPFWKHFYPEFRKSFPSLASVPMETFYRAINKVAPSLIRTDADEVTYNLHVMIRFDLEIAMLEGKLAVRDLPEAWRARYQSDLGVSSPTDRDGCLQDVHWFAAPIGGTFQGYTIGNVLAAQLFESATKTEPSFAADFERGEFSPLREWLRTNVHQHGRLRSPSEVIEGATGTALRIEPYMGYLRGKYSEIYGL